MGRANHRTSWPCAAALLLAAAVAGCCRGSSCDALPPEKVKDGGGDGPVACGTQVCDASQVCCLTGSPPTAACVDPARFDALGCAKMGLGCALPNDCPAGTACCLTVDTSGTSATLSCQQALPCLGGAMSLVVCGASSDCPIARPTCTPFISDPRTGLPISVCE